MENLREKYKNLKTPCFIVREDLLRKNLEILHTVMERTGCRILLAQKCFSMFKTYPLIGQFLAGTTASGLYEARLGKKYMGGETHIYSVAYREDEMDEILSICDHIIFNSMSQWKKYRAKALKAGITCGLRINPQCSTQEGHAIYDPCAKGSRMGITIEQFDERELDGITGLHFHTLCEQNADALSETLDAVEEKFGQYLPRMKWVNFGGGHHITREDYDLELLISCINRIKEKYGLQVYLEPGEAVALNTGYLMSTVLDIVENDGKIAILDTSAACHMPDVLEMPYIPPLAAIWGAISAEKERNYRLAGPTCLSGDVIGDYKVNADLQEGDRILFGDMAIYSMVKTNTFNGMKLPDIYLDRGEKIELIRSFGYEDFERRL